MEAAGSVGLSVLGADLGGNGNNGNNGNTGVKEKFGDGKRSRGAERGQDM